MYEMELWEDLNWMLIFCSHELLQSRSWTISFPNMSNSGWSALLWLSDQLPFGLTTFLVLLLFTFFPRACHLRTQVDNPLLRFCLTPVPMDKIHILAKPQPSPLFWNRHWQEWDFTRQGRKRGTFQTKAQTQKACWRWMPEEGASGPVWVQLSNMSLYLRSASAELHTPTAH